VLSVFFKPKNARIDFAGSMIAFFLKLSPPARKKQHHRRQHNNTDNRNRNYF
jgi:hypothetical protein